MAKVDVEIHEEDVDGESGIRSGLRLICGRCGLEVEVYGTSDASARRGAIMLREECPNGENNFYDVNWWRG